MLSFGVIIYFMLKFSSFTLMRLGSSSLWPEAGKKIPIAFSSFMKIGPFLKNMVPEIC